MERIKLLQAQGLFRTASASAVPSPVQWGNSSSDLLMHAYSHSQDSSKSKILSPEGP